MTKYALFFIAFLCSSLFFSCEKRKLEDKPFDFSYADDIAGTYIGVVHRNDGPYGYSPYQYIYEDSVTVVISDLRNDKTCQFYVDYFDEVIIVKPDMTYVTSWYYHEENSFAGLGSRGGLSFVGNTIKYVETYKPMWNKYSPPPTTVCEFILVKQP